MAEEIKTPVLGELQPIETPTEAPIKEPVEDVQELEATPQETLPLGKVEVPIDNAKALSEVNIPVDKIPGGKQTYDYLQKLKKEVLNGVPPELLKEWDEKGEIGWIESVTRKDKRYLVPHSGDIAEAVELGQIYATLKKAQKGEKISSSEYQLAKDFIRNGQEEAARGFTTWGNISAGVVESAVFGAELATSLGIAAPKKLAVKATSKIAKEAATAIAEEMVKAGIKKGVKKSLGKTVIEGAGRAAKKTLKEKFPTLAVTKVPLASNSISINDSMYVTDKGKTIFLESDENPVKTAFRATGEVFIEAFSEMAGGEVVSPLLSGARKGVARFANKMSPAVVKGFGKLIKSTTNLPVKKALEKFGWNGLLEEIGEERLGGFLTFVTDLDPEDGWSVEQAVDNIFWGSKEEMLTEIGTIGFGGSTSASMGYLANKFQGKFKRSDLEYLDETEIDTLAKKEELVETKEEVKNFEKLKEFKKQEIIETGRPEIEAQHTVDVLDAFYSNLGKQKGASRLEAARLAGEPFFRKSDNSIFTEGQTYGQDGTIKTETPQFKEWFGDSKVVDEAGKPLTVYHGSDVKIEEFKEEKSATGVFWFSSNKEVIEKGESANKTDVITSAYISLKNPASRAEYDKLGIDELIRDGYDGIKLEDNYIVFDPKQIKSVDNKGTFSKDTANIFNQDRRGAFDPNKNIVHVLENADASTLQHELAHYFLNAYDKLLPERMQEIVNFTGFKGRTFSELNSSEAREVNERFAESYEQYIREGIAPNSKLKKAFDDFKEWLKNIYADLKSFRIPLSNDARMFFDKMLDADVTNTGDLYGQDAVETLKEVYEGLKKGKLVEKTVNGVRYTVEDIKAVINSTMLKGKKKGKELQTFINNKGGIDDSSGELSAMDSPYKIKGTTEPDMMAEALWEAGYIPNRDINEMYSAIRDSIGGKKVYSSAYDFEAEADLENQSLVEDSEKIMSEVGIEADFAIEKIKELKDIEKSKEKTTTQNKLEAHIKKQPIPDAMKVDLMGKVKYATTPSKLLELARQVDRQSKIGYDTAQKKQLEDKIQKEVTSSRNVKVGSVSEGRFDYKNTKLFEKIREINRMNTSQAAEAYQKEWDDFEERMNSEDIPNRQEEIAMRFLRYKSRGVSNSSVALMDTVYNDLMEAKRLGSIAKDNAEYEKAMTRRSLIDKASKKIDELTPGKRGSIRKALQSHAGDWDSISNELFGKELSDDLSLITSQSKEKYEKFFVARKTTKDISEIYGLKGKNQLPFKMMEMGRLIKDVELKRKDKRFTGQELSKLDIVDIYNGIKNKDSREAYEHHYGMDQINKLIEENLTEKDKVYADYLVKFYSDYHPKINKVFTKLYNRDLPTVENYTPRSSEYTKAVDIFNDYTGQSTHASFEKARAKGQVVIKPQNAHLAMQRYTSNAEHIINVGEQYKKIKELMTDGMVKSRIIKKFGKDFYKYTIDTIDDNSLSGVSKRNDAAVNLWNRILSNWTKSVISLNPAVFAKQLISSTNFMTNMPVANWVSGFANGLLLHPISTFKFMMQSKVLQERIEKGNSEEIMRVLRDAEAGIGKTSSFLNSIGINTIGINKAMGTLQGYGDLFAWVYGGYPLVKHYMKTMTQEEAFAKFEKEGLKTQQSGLTSQLSNVQKDSSLRIFSMFKNTLMQYNRVLYNSTLQMRRGEITKAEHAKTIAVIGLLNPALFGAMSYLFSTGLYNMITGGEGDEEELWMEMFTSAITQPINGFPILGDISASILSLGVNQKGFAPKLPVVEDIWRIFANYQNEWDPSLEEFIKTGIQLRTGAPVKAWDRYLTKAEVIE